MKTYIAVYFGALLLAAIVTPLVARLARAMRIVDAPGIRRVHQSATPRLGGVSLVVATLTMLAAVLMLDNVIGRAFREVQTRLIALLAGSVLVFLVGAVDDIRGLRARAKLLVQIAAAVLVCALGIRIGSITVAGITLHFGSLSWPVTILWIVGITNAVNLIDGLDGLAAGISVIACAALTVLALHVGQPVMAVLMLALSGSLTGFLFYNFHPARVFLGDSGSLFLGFTIAVASVMCATKSATLVGLGLPALALGVPILDTLFSMLRRVLQRRSVLGPDRGHIHHRLLAMGVRHPWVVVLIYAVTLVITGLGMFMFITRGAVPLLIFCCVTALLVMVFSITGSVRFRESLACLQRNLTISQEAKGQKRRFEEAARYFDEAVSFDTWWESVCMAADQMDFAELRMQFECHDGSAQTLIWRHQEVEVAADEMAHMTVPVRHRHLGDPLQIECDVPVHGSLESVTRRMTLFSRLIDKYSPASLPRDS